MSLLIARQPIFDNQMKVIAYELLFRDSKTSINAFPSNVDSNTATSKLISGLQFNHGLQAFTGKARV